MKKQSSAFIFLILLFLSLSSASLAQQATTTQSANLIIGDRILEQFDRIMKVYAKKIINKQQVLSLQAKVRAVEAQEMIFLKQNHILTTAQASQLNAMLDATSKQIGGTPGVAPKRHFLKYNPTFVPSTPTVRATKSN